MFDTIKAKFALYKWGFIILTLTGLTVFAGIQYYQIKLLNTSAEEATKTITEQNDKIIKLTEKVSRQEANMTQAMDRLIALRLDIEGISKDTKELEGKVNRIPKPTTGGANADDIEDEINKLSDEIIDRMRTASKGK